MKQSRFCAILSIVAFCFLLLSTHSRLTRMRSFPWRSQAFRERAYNGEDVYPYYGSAGGNPVTLMCISFTADMNLGETWTAEKESLPASPTFEEAAWLFNDANAALRPTTPTANRLPISGLRGNSSLRAHTTSAPGTAPRWPLLRLITHPSLRVSTSNLFCMIQYPGPRMRMALLSFFWDMEIKHPTHRVPTPDPPIHRRMVRFPSPAALSCSAAVCWPRKHHLPQKAFRSRNLFAGASIPAISEVMGFEADAA